MGMGSCDYKYNFKHSCIFCRLEVSRMYYFFIYNYRDICSFFLFKHFSNSPVFHIPAGYDISSPFRGFVYWRWPWFDFSLWRYYGGVDVIARLVHKYVGWSMGKTIFYLILLLSQHQFL